MLRCFSKMFSPHFYYKTYFSILTLCVSEAFSCFYNCFCRKRNSLKPLKKVSQKQAFLLLLNTFKTVQENEMK